jgi:hypothetical protein
LNNREEDERINKFNDMEIIFLSKVVDMKRFADEGQIENQFKTKEIDSEEVSRENLLKKYIE